jgi:hypothetical protein
VFVHVNVEINIRKNKGTVHKEGEVAMKRKNVFFKLKLSQYTFLEETKEAQRLKTKKTLKRTLFRHKNKLTALLCHFYSKF